MGSHRGLVQQYKCWDGQVSKITLNYTSIITIIVLAIYPWTFRRHAYSPTDQLTNGEGELAVAG